MALTKDNLHSSIQERLGFTSKEAKEALELAIEQIKATLEAGVEVKVSGFGKWG